MIHPESQDKNLREPFQLPQDFDSDEDANVKVQYSILGFVVNIVIILFWQVFILFNFYALIINPCTDEEFPFLCVIATASLASFSFHLYVLFDCEYGNKKEYQEEHDLAEVIKLHWAAILETALNFLFFGIYGFKVTLQGIHGNDKMFTAIVISVFAVIYAFIGMICWGFATNNRKHILARIVRPWQVCEETENNTINA